MVGNDSPGSWTLPGYAHVQQLGTGAGGRVFLATHQSSGTLVAVKYLVPGLHADGDFREAYRSEAQLLAELDSPHVTRLYEYVEGPEGSAIVMEAVAGSSLRHLMKQEGATWEVTVSSSPTSKNGAPSMTFNPYSNGCVAS